MNNNLHIPKNVSESQGFNHDFVLVCVRQNYQAAAGGAAPGLHLDATQVRCKMLFTLLTGAVWVFWVYLLYPSGKEPREHGFSMLQ